MNLIKKRELVARTFGVGKDRIIFNKERLNDIKEAITKADIRQLEQENAITIAEKRGVRRKEKRRTRRRIGSIRRKVNKSKKEYVMRTRKMRAYLRELKKKDKITREDHAELRRGIRARTFRDKAHLREMLASREKKE